MATASGLPPRHPDPPAAANAGRAGPSDAGVVPDPAAATQHAQPLHDPGPEPPARAGHDPSLLQIAQELLDDLRGAVQARFHLLALEARRAGLALTMMALYAVLAALLALTAWVCGWALAIVLATAAGVPFGVVLAVALVVSLLAVWLLLRMARAEAHHLLFSASVRQFAPNRAPDGGPLDPSPAEPPGVTARPAAAAH